MDDISLKIKRHTKYKTTHEGLAHPGSTKLYNTIKNYVRLNKITKVIPAVVNACLKCASAKGGQIQVWTYFWRNS